MRPLRPSRRLTGLLIAAAAVLALPVAAGARAGGGGGFHSTGGGGHGSGGGGSGGGWDAVELMIDLIRFIIFCFSYPLVGVPVLLVVAGAAVYYFYWMPASSRSSSSSSLPPLPAARTDVTAVEVVRAHDPAFDPEAFCERVTAGFLKLQDAWCRQDLRAVRPFISDGVHERFSIQFAEQKALGYHDQMEQVVVDSAAVVDATSYAVYDTVAVRVSARAVDYRAALAGGAYVSGSRAVEPFAEVWSFLRRRDASTVPGRAGLLEGNCPNCGAAVQMNESANCGSCGALLRSGLYDWVLAEITQASEWQRGGRSDLPGLEQLRERDPDLNVQAVEDRASVVFWRRAMADRVGKVDPLRKAATDKYCAASAKLLRPGPDGHRRFTGECAVGAVDTVGFIPAADASGLDRAVVDVDWTGRLFTALGDGSPPRPGPEATRRTLLVLGRRADAKTDVAKGISSAHCPQCGAPESGGVGGACDFCGAVLNDGSHGWVLVDLLPADGEAADALQAEIAAAAGIGGVESNRGRRYV